MPEEFKEIIDFIKSPVFSSSARIGILLVLLGVDKITFTDLLNSVEMSKSSLYSHLKVLEENEMIVIRDVFTLTRPRTIIQITPKGKAMVERYLQLLENYVKKNK
ncbi:transcriptional regulator [Acidianus brierleyi]|uniref:ArsR family transcriptional regulator n=1 Tax=Acidianus brierleyi TaxID=41673 RepID=A0A2U9IHN6_9CREN|nr:transcriptional regulator [Acidianus brierleyi]AWR95539.1 ArsR family transcriptional regulator [Acidianus brierleyi]